MNDAPGKWTETESDRTRFEVLLETAVDGIIVIDGAGIVQAYNPACEGLFGFQKSEVVGRNVKMLMPEPYQHEHDQYLANYRGTGKKKIIGIGRQVFGRRKDGSTFPMYLSVGEGRLNGESIYVGIINDLTERVRAERRLKDLQSELLHVSRVSEMGQMASALAHELNQPLTAITNYVKAASRTLSNAAKDDDSRTALAMASMNKAADQTLRAGHIVRRLREFIAKGDSQREFENINTIIEEAMGLALVGSAESEVKVHMNLVSDLPAVHIDRIQIQQVIINLVRNSLDALKEVEERHLFIDTGLEKDFVAVKVSDTGPGLLPEIADRIFQPFSTTKQDGMGMGLSICRSIIDAHGGEILWEPPKSGGGTSFRFLLPVSSPEGESEYDE